MPPIPKFLRRFAALALPSFFSLGHSVSAGQFTAIPISIPGLRYASVAWGDFDKDGKPDLLVSGDTGTNSITRIYRNTGGGNFVDIQAGLPGISNGAVAWGDYNGDGYLDFALTGMTSTGRVTRIYRNAGNGTFTDINANLPGLDSSKLAWGDYDNDGDLDLFVSGYTGSAYFARIYRNDGNDQFTDSGVTTIVAGANAAAAWADFDNDGDLDLIFDGFTGDTTYGQSSRLYRNNNGTFTNITSISLTAMSLCSVGWEDYDNDGNLDLLMAGSSIAGVQSYPTLRLYHNNGSGTSFTSISSGMPGAQNCSLAWGDFDNDGLPDVAIAGYNSSFAPFAAVYWNLGGGVFADAGAGLSGVIDTSVACGDFDNDGDLDLLVSGFDGTTNITRLYRNDTFFANQIPAPPSGLASGLDGKSATFYWGSGSDGNQGGGFTYNLRVGTAPGADNVMPSHADATTGFRRLPALGNVDQQLSWTLKLPVGTYYWSVQTIDHAFAGSPFAPEEVLVIPPQMPDVATLPATNINLNNATLRGVANPNGDDTVVYFEYGLDTGYGNTTPAQDIGSGTAQASFSAVLRNLLPAVAYQYRAVASNSFGVNYGTNQSFLTPLFSEAAGITLQGGASGSVSWGDYDNDGFLDVIIAGGNSTGAVSRVYHNLGGTNFVEIPAGLPGISGGGQAVWGDYDNDGRLDVLLTGSFLSRIYHNDGGGVFTDINAGLPGQSTGASAAWSDFNNDGNLDFAMVGAGGLPVKTYRNEASGIFTDVTNSMPKLSDSSIAWADSDNNGAMDLLVTGYNYGAGGLGEMTRLYRNDGRGNFTNSNISFQAVSRGSVAWGDYNNDGFMDFLLTGSTGSGLNRYSIIYSNNGAGSFVAKTVSGVTKMDQSSVAWGDFNNDGLLDFAATGMTSTGAVVKVYRNDGGTLFRDSGAALPGLPNATLAWGDFDNDGRLDLLVTGYSGSNYVARLYHNNSLDANTPPSGPTALSTTVNNNSATLTWSPSTDANQTGGLTYNLRVGTTPGGSDALNPMADGATGFRRVPRLGNAGLRQSWTLTNLLVGTYYWAVQAVDHSYAGSAFSTNGTFTITAALLPPVAITKGTTNIGLASVTLQGAANPKGAVASAFFQYGTTTNFGNSTAAQAIGSGNTNVPVNALVRGLADGATYYFRMAASNINGTVFGSTLSFTTGFQFSNIVTSISAASAVAWGDFDNDGDLDLAVSSLGLPGTYLYRNDGGGLFTLVNTNLPPAYYGMLEWGDYNRDGYLDLLVAGSSQLSIVRNNGDGSFTTTQGFSGTEFATWVDYDNDGDLDICCYDSVGSNTSYAQARLYRNDNGVFVPSGVPMPQLTAGSMAWGDYDGDGFPDLAVTGQIIITNYIHDLTRIHHNDGDGNFTDINAPLTGLEYGRIFWSDVDNDGNLDLVVNGGTPSPTLTIVYRNTNGTFTDAGAGLPGARAPMSLGDFDNDGYPDIVLQFPGEYTTTNRLYRNNGNGTFSDSGKTFPGAVASIAWADYNKDGNLDVLVGPQLYRNNNLVTNRPPGAPTGLNASRNGNVVTLTWNPATDPNQSGGLTYNLAVGTAPGSYYALSPEADTNGWRRVAKPGIASHPVWKLVLPVGTYYWKVQAVDAAFAGSPFSAEASFTVPAQAPRVLTLSATTNAAGYPIMNGSANPNSLATTAWFEYGATNFEFQTAPQALGSGIQVVSLASTPATLVPETTYNFRLVASNSLGKTFGATRTFALPYFNDRTADLPPGSISILAWGDYDNDGAPDLLVQGYYAISLYHNENGVFTNLVTTFAFLFQGSAAWGDIDNDGDLDLLVTGHDNVFQRQTKLYRNDGGGHFTEIPNPLTGVDNSAVAWADFNNDGRLDLLVTGTDTMGAGVIQLCRNDGNGVLTLIPTSLPTVGDGPVITCVDYDNDGRVDILMAGLIKGARSCRLYHNDGNFSFSDSGQVFPGLGYGSASWGDYDNDGRLDLLLNGVNGSNYMTKVFRNLSGGFQELPLNLPGLVGGSAWLDYDNDGKLDILLRGLTNIYGFNSYITRLYRNTGSGLFSDSGLPLPLAGNSSPGLWVADFDHDRDADLLTQDGHLLRNESNINNPAPVPPGGLTGSVLRNSVTLAWSAGSDPNQAAGLTYDVRVGTSAGAGDILSGMSLADGRRLLPDLGNAFARLNLSLSNLNVDTYYWSVQSIDHSGVSSSFASSASFVIPVQAPAIQPRPVSNLAAQSVTLNALVNANGAAAVAWFEYGLTTNYNLRTATQNLGSATAPLLVSSALTGLAKASVYHYHTVASNSFGLISGPDQTFTTPWFTSVPITLLTNGVNTITVGDFNGDGALDFLANDSRYYHPPVLLGDGLGGFTNALVSVSNLNLTSAACGDYNNDNQLDVASIEFSNPNYFLKIYTNAGTGLFAYADGFVSNYGPVDWGDFDNNGSQDLAATGAGTDIFRHSGTNQLARYLSVTLGGSVNWGDYDGDGRLDLLVAGVDQNNSAIATKIFHINVPAGISDSGIVLPGVFGRAMWVDYDGDGKPDIFLGGPTNNYYASVGTPHLYHNVGNGQFNEIPCPLPGMGELVAIWGDFDGDGLPDVLMQGYLDGHWALRLFHNDGNGGFTDMNLAAPAALYPGALAWGDFNGDGKLDFIVTCSNSTNNFALLYLNNSQPASSPSAPTALSANVNGNACTFSWTAPGQTRGLTYNLRVGTAPGATDVVSPLANVSTGARRLPKAGNAGAALNHTLTNLSAGTYYWSVQTINSAFASSPFAPEQTFVRGTQPTANPQLVVLPEDTTRAITLTGSDPDGRTLTFALVTQPTNGTLSGIPPTVLYQPATNYFGADSFTFRVNNGLTDSPPAQIAVAITQVPDTAGASLSLRRANGQFILSLTGEPYDHYRIEASQDLVHWIVITNLLPTSGPLPFVDPDAHLYSRRFYRPVWQVAAPRLASPIRLANGAFQVSFNADIGRYYKVLASTNLHDWVVLTNVAAVSGNVLFLDSSATNYPRRFYQALPTP